MTVDRLTSVGHDHPGKPWLDGAAVGFALPDVYAAWLIRSVRPVMSPPAPPPFADRSPDAGSTTNQDRHGKTKATVVRFGRALPEVISPGATKTAAPRCERPASGPDYHQDNGHNFPSEQQLQENNGIRKRRSPAGPGGLVQRFVQLGCGLEV